MAQPAWEDTTNQIKGSSGGRMAEKAGPVSRRSVSLPSAENGTLGASTAHFLDDERQAVKQRQVGSGEGSSIED